MKHRFTGLFSLLVLSFLVPQYTSGQSGPDRLRVLFLGDNGHHEPSQRVLQILPYMAERGIQVVYTDDVGALTKTNLAHYHVLLLFGNTPTITKEQEAAMLQFVQNGGGLAPIHAGIAMFSNSDAYMNMAGGTFKSHGEGTFTTRFLEPNHPILEGLQPFESWDESYIHQKHNPDKTVLSVHEEDGRVEPWTWVRNHGQGRVFYTAWGHDERTWSNPGFHQLLERGLRWAAGDWALSSNWAPPRLSYSAGEMPFYPAGEGWGVTGEPFREVQNPLSPEASLQQAFVQPGFEMRVFASEPDVINPIDMTWDEQGRLWVTETTDYPNTFTENRVGEDRIKILEDTNGDGLVDKSTIFAEGLNIPTSIVLANGGVIVAHAPDMLFLKDTDGDDRADVKETLFTGWGTFDTHAGPNNLRYGFDNQIWGAVGYSAFNGAINGDSIRFGQALFRFAPDGSTLEHMATFNNNTWGLSFSEEGHVFGSTANGNPSMFSAIPERFYTRLDSSQPFVLNTIADNAALFPSTDHVRQVDWHGLYTAGSGYEIYTARLFPSSYWNRTAFIGAPTAHLLGQFDHHAKGSGFVAKNRGSFVSSRDDWFAPIQMKVGPDGALWVIDWYNPIIQHNPTPPGYEQGEGNAYEIDLRDTQHSRIYRILPQGATMPEPMNLAEASTANLIEALKNDNLFWRLTAQRLLVEQQDHSVIPLLITLIGDLTVDGAGLNPAAIHALWALKGLGALDGSNSEALAAATQALHHPSVGVQRNALQVLPRTEATFDAILNAGFLPDPAVPEGMSYTVGYGMMDVANASTKLEALLAIAEMPSMRRAGEAVANFISVGENARDEGLATAATVAAMSHSESFLGRMISLNPIIEDDSVFTAALTTMISKATAELAASSAPAIPEAVFNMDGLQESWSAAILDGLLAGWPESSKAAWEGDQRQRFISMYENAPASLEERLRSLRQRLE